MELILIWLINGMMETFTTLWFPGKMSHGTNGKNYRKMQKGLRTCWNSRWSFGTKQIYYCLLDTRTRGQYKVPLSQTFQFGTAAARAPQHQKYQKSFLLHFLLPPKSQRQTTKTSKCQTTTINSWFCIIWGKKQKCFCVNSEKTNNRKSNSEYALNGHFPFP